jgi:hypothetical protein
MTNQDTQILGDEGAALGGALAPSSRSGTRRREPVILIHQSAPPPVVSGDAIEPEGESSFVPIGSIAIRLVARWALPRMQMMLAQGRRGLNPAPASAHRPGEED